MDRHVQAGGLALAASLLLHAAILAVLGDYALVWEAPAATPPIEARLVERARLAPAPPAPAVRPRPAPAVVTPPPVETPPATAVDPEAAASLSEENDAETGEMAEAAPVALPEAEAEAEAETEAQQPAVADAPPPLNPLPPRIDMRFSAHYGFATGEQTLVWVSDGTHYTLTSVAAATGLVGVFYRGRLVQTSHGRVTSEGLQPEIFWDQRGDRRSTTRFDRTGGRLTLTPDQGAPQQVEEAGGVQDLLSVVFQFVLTAPPDGPQRHAVYNGKKLRHYTFEPRGEVMLDTALGPLRTLHLARAGNAGGRFEVWLALDRDFLPVRVLRGDDDGAVAELRVLAIGH